MNLFAGKVVVVTGAGNGIGRAEALAFAAAGARVVVNDVGGARDGTGRDQRAADAVVAEIAAAGGEAVASHASVSDVDGAAAIVWAGVGKWGRVDVLVNNAGILRDRSLVNMSEAEWDAVIAVHLKGAFLTTRAFARAIKQQGPGDYALVNTSSVSGLMGNFGQANYAAAKAGIYGFTRTAAIELAKSGCRANAIAPIALTRMTEDLPSMKEAADRGPEHVAPVVLWLASSLAKGITGRVFGVHGAHVFEYAMRTSPGVTAPPEGAAWTPAALAQNLSRFALEQT
jgi:NAD(P)-dependent dehydrogenase (short-subunit alcohol dehydrogenase family)